MHLRCGHKQLAQVPDPVAAAGSVPACLHSLHEQAGHVDVLNDTAMVEQQPVAL
jgi:hypothetical protein